MKVLFGYLSVEFRGGVKFQLDFAENFDHTEVGFLTSNKTIKYRDRAEKIGPIHLLPPTREKAKRAEALKKLAQEYDVIYLNKSILNDIELSLVKNAGFKKIVYHSHSTTKQSKNPLEKMKYFAMHFTEKDSKNPVMQALYFYLHYKARARIAKVADGLYACSPEAGDWLFGRKHRNKVTVINNGVNSDMYRYDPQTRERVRQEMGLTGTVVFHAGAFSAVKNQQYLIRAFSLFLKQRPDSVLLLAGVGELQEQAKAVAKECNIEDHVRFLGLRNDVPALLQASDMMVMPSLHEGLPFVAIEAQSAGVMCLVTNTASSQTRITSDLCEFFDVTAPIENLADLMLKHCDYDRRDTYDEVTKAGFNLKLCAKELETRLEKLVANDRS